MAEIPYFEVPLTDVDLENQRLQALEAFGIFDTEPELLFDDLTRWGAMLLRVPIAIISFVGRERVAFKSIYGYQLSELPRQDAFCDFTIQGNDVFVVPSVLDDARFPDFTLVKGDLQVRFYAAAPLITSDGFRIGTFGVVDRQPRDDFGVGEHATLRELARLVMRELEARRQVSNLDFQQELNIDIAGARDFQTALTTVLRRTGERLGACYCLVPQEMNDSKFYCCIAGAAITTSFDELISVTLAQPARETTALERDAILGEQNIIDTGALDPKILSQHTEQAKLFYAAGVRRQISVPFRLGSRRTAMLVGFERSNVSKPDRDFLSDMVVKLVPLLFGRLREEEVLRQRRQTEYVNRAMRTLIGANQVLSNAATESELMQSICEVAVRLGGYAAAWVGFAEHGPDKKIRVAAKWGSNLEMLESVPLVWADTPSGGGSSAIAVRENRVAVIHDIARDLSLEAYGHVTLPALFGSCISVPLRDLEGQVLGVFTLYNLVRDQKPPPGTVSFDREEEELLTELARDIMGGITIIRDRFSRDEALQRQRASDSRFTNLLAASPAILIVLEFVRSEWRFIEISPNFERILGYPAADAMDNAWWLTHTHPDDQTAVREAVLGTQRGGSATFQYRIARETGGYFWLQAEVRFEPAKGDQPGRIAGTLNDITERHEAQNQIHRLAYFDQLTGLPNRQLFRDQLSNMLFDFGRKRNFCALLFIDLDRFKAINDVHGHFAGDQVLVLAGQRLRDSLREEDLVARLGGDEFVVLLSKLGSNRERASAQASVLAQRIATALDQEMVIENFVVQVTASIGIYLFGDRNKSLEQILQMADIAMYTAKATAKGQAYALEKSNISVFEAAMQQRVTRYHGVKLELKKALAEQRMELWLQPQVDEKGRIIGAEALIRLRREDGSLMQPNEFITVAEETGLIVPVGEWVRAEACRLLARISPARLPRISVNISAIEFRQPHLVDDLLALLGETGVDPKRLKLELTESLLIDRVDETIAKLTSFCAAGLTISIDDFGTGYSSLGYLQRMPIHEIKIDKRFVNDMLFDQRSADLIRTIIMLARNFNFDVVAEGVESRAQADFLIEQRCSFMQGYLFGRPRPATEFNIEMDVKSCQPGATT